MPSFTSPDNIQYPVGTDPVAPLANVFENLAQTAQAAITSVDTAAQNGITTLTNDLNALDNTVAGLDNFFGPKFFLETTVRTANYTLALTDINKVVPMNGTSLTLTIPTEAAVAFPVGTVVNVYNLNSTLVIIQGDAGVTLRNAGNLLQYNEVSLRKRDTNEWVAAGSLI